MVVSASRRPNSRRLSLRKSSKYEVGLPALGAALPWTDQDDIGRPISIRFTCKQYDESAPLPFASRIGASAAERGVGQCGERLALFGGGPHRSGNSARSAARPCSVNV